MDWVQLVTGVMSGGTVMYLIVEKLFSRKKDSAEAHGTMVASFDKEMESLRKIRLDMIEDVSSMQRKVREEREKLTTSISGEVSLLKKQLADSQDAAEKREEQFMQQFIQLGETVQEQAKQLNKMIMYWQLLCDRDCKNRHVPACPLKISDNGEA